MTSPDGFRKLMPTALIFGGYPMGEKGPETLITDV
jgi:hypothetical protein